MSARVSTSIALNVACSGAMYSGVPATVPKALYRLCSVSCRPLVALARPKSMTLGTGVPSWLFHQDVRRLQVAMDDSLLMGMLHGRADLAEQVQAFQQPQPVLVAIVRERNALHQLHHEERPAGFGRTGVEDLGDVGVVHQRQGLPLGLEPGQHGSRIHARLDQLEGHFAFDWLNCSAR